MAEAFLVYLHLTQVSGDIEDPLEEEEKEERVGLEGEVAARTAPTVLQTILCNTSCTPSQPRPLRLLPPQRRERLGFFLLLPLLSLRLHPVRRPHLLLFFLCLLPAGCAITGGQKEESDNKKEEGETEKKQRTRLEEETKVCEMATFLLQKIEVSYQMLRLHVIEKEEPLRRRPSLF